MLSRCTILFVSAWLQSLDALGDGYRCLFGQKRKFGSPQIHMVFPNFCGKRGTVVWLNETCYRIVWLCSRIFWKNANPLPAEAFMAFPVKDSIQHLRNINFCYRRGGGESAKFTVCFLVCETDLGKKSEGMVIDQSWCLGCLKIANMPLWSII